MKVEAAGSSETSSLYNTYDVVFQQTVAAVMRVAVSENTNAGTARNGTNCLAVDIETLKNWVI